MLPDEAVAHFEVKEYLFENTEKNMFEMIEIEIGESENGYKEIISKTELSRKEFVTKVTYTLLMSLKNKEE